MLAGFEEEIKLANPLLSGLSRLGGSAIAGGMNLGRRLTPMLGQNAGRAVTGTVANAATSGMRAMGGAENLRQAVGAGIAGAGLLGAGAAAHKLTS